jgi:hypothetical protein
MTAERQEPWSAARNPYAIAVSQSQWALWAADLFARDARENRGDTHSQIYARQIFGQLRTLHRCAEMMARELKRLRVDKRPRDHLRQAIDSFDAQVPGAKSARDILEHFDEHARGEGKLVKQAMRDLDIDVYEAAAMYWGGGYNPATDEVREGPFVIVIPDALAAAKRLQRAIYAAGQAVDRHRASS